MTYRNTIQSYMNQSVTEYLPTDLRKHELSSLSNLHIGTYYLILLPFNYYLHTNNDNYMWKATKPHRLSVYISILLLTDYYSKIRAEGWRINLNSSILTINKAWLIRKRKVKNGMLIPVKTRLVEEEDCTMI